MRRIPIALGLLAALVAIGFGWSRVTTRSATVADPAPVPSSVPVDEGGLETPVSWQGVDLEEVRAALPNNRYWTTGLPTTDPAVIADRARAADARNQLLGKVLSGN